MEIEVIHNPDMKEFYFIINGVKGFLLYEEIRENTLEFYHTYVPPAFRKQGAAEKLVMKASEYAMKNNKKVVPTCSYAEFFFRKHPELAEILKRK